MAPNGEAGSLLICPRCRTPLEPDTACRACGLDVRHDGIMDFVQGAATTTLDNIDYDAHYAVSLERADREFAAVKALMGPRLPAAIGTAIEIGCGTGGFTTGLLRGIEIGTAILTDISPNMLGICRRRLADAGLLAKHRTVLATYSGREACFGSGAYDLCVGSFVVHHILDVGAFFADMSRLLRPNGSCFFMEPNTKFHLALVQTVADIVAVLISRNRNPHSIALMMNWLAEVNYNLKHEGDLELLARREDKHCFSRASVERLAEPAGFLSVELIPYGEIDNGTSSLFEYMRQVGIGGDLLEEVMALGAGVAPRYFDLIDPSEAASSSIIYLSKVAASDGPPKVKAKIAPPSAHMDPAVVVDIELTWHGGKLGLLGWACAPAPIRRLTVTAGNVKLPASVWLPRRDVFEAIGGLAGYPALHALSSGISEEFICELQPTEVALTLTMANGAEINLGSQRLTNGTVRFH